MGTWEGKVLKTKRNEGLLETLGKYISIFDAMTVMAVKSCSFKFVEATDEGNQFGR